jgi:gas vesicle protein
MKNYLLLPAVAALMISPALAQSTNSGNLKPNSDVIKNAEESAKPKAGAADDNMKANQADGTSTNSGNLKPNSDVIKNAEESAKPKPGAENEMKTERSSAADGTSTNSGHLKPNSDVVKQGEETKPAK